MATQMPHHQTPEFQLVEYLERLSARREGRFAVVCHLSRLQPYNQRPHHLRIAQNNFERLLEQTEGRVFSLRNKDLVYVGKISSRHAVDEALMKLRYTFSSDPLVFSQNELGEGNAFSSWYGLEKDFQGLYDFAQKLYHSSQTGFPADLEKKATTQKVPINPDQLGWLEEQLNQTNLANLIRNQPICALDIKDKLSPMFFELYVAINELGAAITPNIDLQGNRWLFQYLTTVLDRRMLSYLSAEGEGSKRAFSFNSNISTVLSEEFQQFDQNVSTNLRGRLVIEMHMTDIFADMGAYLFARDYLVERGYKICLDGLTHLTAPFIDRKKMGFDFVKIHWSPELITIGTEQLSENLGLQENADEKARVILCRCDDNNAIEAGKKIGITLFQGRHVDQRLRQQSNMSTLRKV